MTTITKAIRRGDTAHVRDVEPRTSHERGDARSAPELSVECSTAAWSMSGPATSGGDAADAFALSDECVFAAVWDVAGRGKAAASDAVLVRAGLRALLGTNPDIAIAVLALNRVLFRRAGAALPCPFVKGFFGLVNRATRTLRYISCGHETAILFRGRNAHVHLRHNSPLLGVSEAADLTVDTERIEPGDRLVVVSDGVSDARPLHSQATLFGTTGVCSYFRFAPSGSGLDAARFIEHVVGLAGGALADDAAALIARFI